MTGKQRENVAVDQLNDMQRYLGAETVEDYQLGVISRRRLLKRLILICGSGAAAAALLAACGDTATPVTTTTVASTTNTTAPASTTTAVTTSATSTTVVATTAASTTTSLAGGTTVSGSPASTTSKSPLSVAADDPAIEASDIVFQSDTTVMGYLVRPKAPGNYPGIIVIHQNTGLNDHIKDVTRRVAKAGYIALAPDLVSRSGGTAKYTADQIAGILAKANPTDLVKDLNATESFLEKQSGVEATKIGVVGFCYGGGYTLRLAAANPKIVAAVSYYGPVPQPVSQMSATHAAILGQYGALDKFVNPGIPALEQVLKDNGKTYEKKIYDGANHAFNDDTKPSYDPAAALPAWQATLDWFTKYLKA